MGSASLLFQHLMNGLTLGGIYALIALGYTMVYGILKFINFAHGDILMVGAYIGLFTFDALRGSTPIGIWWLVSFFIAMVVSMMGCAVLGMAIEKIAYKPLRDGSRLAPLLSAIGVSFILSNGAAWMFGTHSRKFNYPFDNSPISIGGVVITPHQIMVLVVAIVMMVALKIFVDKTKMGKAMRATSLDSETAKLMGVNADMIISLTFGIGSSLAACGRMLIALDYKVYATMGTMVGLKAFVAAVLGGIGILPGAVAGGIILGVIESLVSGFISSTFRDAAAFAILILVLLFKPSGIFGKNTREKV